MLQHGYREETSLRLPPVGVAFLNFMSKGRRVGHFFQKQKSGIKSSEAHSRQHHAVAAAALYHSLLFMAKGRQFLAYFAQDDGICRPRQSLAYFAQDKPPAIFLRQLHRRLHRHFSAAIVLHIRK